MTETKNCRCCQVVFSPERSTQHYCRACTSFADEALASMFGGQDALDARIRHHFEDAGAKPKQRTEK